jgi:TolA-binding protein
MATEDVKATVQPATPEKPAEDRVAMSAEQFWSKNSKSILIGLLVVVIGVGGFLAYKNFVSKPNEEKAATAIWKAESNFRTDSFKLALNGDAMNPGFLKVISQYGGTKSGNRAKFYAGACYLQLGDFNNAIKYLKDYSGGEVAVDVRANGLLGDAYSELGKKEDAVSYYKKAGSLYPEDDINSPEYLFRAALLLQDLGKTQEAVTILKDIKNKYPRSSMPAMQGGQDIDKYLGKMGETK